MSRTPAVLSCRLMSGREDITLAPVKQMNRTRNMYDNAECYMKRRHPSRVRSRNIDRLQPDEVRGTGTQSHSVFPSTHLHLFLPSSNSILGGNILLSSSQGPMSTRSAPDLAPWKGTNAWASFVSIEKGGGLQLQWDVLQRY